MCGWLFKHIHVVKLKSLVTLDNDQLKINNPINICLISPIIIPYYF